jgi:acetylornithine deacetylase/succinyl-diaminopimelate desuccinylase-like protein
LAYIAAHKDRFISELMCFLRIPSVSSDEVYVDSVKEAADFVKGQLEQSGADFAVVEPTKRHPVVYGERFVDASLPTVLVYGHYDVQPVDPIELWQHPPFEPIIQDEKIYARGACDDKGQMFMHLKSLEYMVASQQSFCNLKFVFEGEEEIGSPSFENYLVENRDKLKADVVLVSDTAMIDLNIPSIVYGLKGITYFDIEVIGSSKDLHSGIYGGAISNPLNVLCSMIARLHDDNKVITIPNFYQDIIPPTKEEFFSVHQIPFCLEKYKSDGGIKEVAGEKGFDTLENIAFRPTLDVNGMWGGYTGEGAKTVIPSKAFAKISMRLVPGQSAEAIISSFSDYFKSLAPEGMEVKIEVLASCESALLPIDSIPYKAAEEALRKTFGRDPVPVRMGGSIPVISMFKKTLGINSILMGFGLDSDDIHSPNEHFGIPNFLKGIETIPLFYKYYYESMLHAKVNPEQLDLHSL